jgi:glutathione S-transferase
MPYEKIQVIGSYLSPYVRKLLVCLDIKGLEYEIDPIAPFYGSDTFGRLSPLRRIPILIDGDVCLADSTVICEYLEGAYPEKPLLPTDISNRARCRWYEEYADSRMGEVFIWHLYNQRIIRKYVWGQAPNETILNKTLNEDIPQIMDYLESSLPSQGFLFGDLSLADISIASFFRNATFANYVIDKERWPIAAAHVNAVLSLPSFKGLQDYEGICLRTPIQEQREALAKAGAPVWTDTFAKDLTKAGMLAS